jgi:hypothetical protein
LKLLLIGVSYLLFVLLAACAKEEKFVPIAQTAKASATTVASPTPLRAPTSYDEPPEQVLRDFMFAQYAVLEANKGLPVTVTATGKSGVLRSKLYSAAKDECHIERGGPPGMFECGMNLMVTLWWDGRPEPTKPSADAKRISVIKNTDGKWIDCSLSWQTNSVCRDGVKLK